MVKIGLKITANLSNVDKLYLQEPQQFGWPLKVKCSGCGEENPNWHIISQEDRIELANGSANFVYKCKCCSRQNSLSIISLNNLGFKNLESEYLEADDGKLKLMIGFDCRGLEPIEFEPRNGWAVQSGKKIFENVDLSSKEWYDYNDTTNEPVEITNFLSQFETLK